MERIDGVKSTGLADEIIVEEYEGQKIDDMHTVRCCLLKIESRCTYRVALLMGI